MARVEYLCGDALADFVPAPKMLGNRDHIACHFDDPAAVYAYTSRRGYRAGAWESAGWTASDSFVGATQAEADGWAVTGWVAGAARVALLRDALTPDRPTGARLVKYDVAGSLPCVPRALAGNPMSMRRIVVAPTKKQPVLTLILEVSCSCDVRAELLTAACVSACAIVDVLEDAGFRVELIASSRQTRGGVLSDVMVRVKQAADPVILPVLAFCLGHSAFFRAHMFRVMGGTPEFRPLTGTLGSPEPLAASNCPPGVYLVPGAQLLRTNVPRVAMAGQIAALRAQGCPGIPAAEEADG